MRLSSVQVGDDVGSVVDYVMTGLTGHLNLLGWCDCNIPLHLFYNDVGCIFSIWLVRGWWFYL